MLKFLVFALLVAAVFYAFSLRGGPRPPPRDDRDGDPDPDPPDPSARIGFQPDGSQEQTRTSEQVSNDP